MTVTVSSPVTGSAQTGFTAPTYTLVADTPPANNSKQWVVTALGGTQTGVIAHSVAAPFSLAFWKPLSPKTLQPVNPVTGILRGVPTNTYKTITRKGVLPLAGQAYSNLIITTSVEVPAGADQADAANIRAALSLHLAALTATSAGLGDTLVNGVL